MAASHTTRSLSRRNDAVADASRLTSDALRPSINIMPRTTVNLDASILRQLKARAKDEGKSLGDVMSEALAPALCRGGRARATEMGRWNTAPLGPPKVELEDKEAVRQVLDDR